jgi:sucrose phosphorylase
MLYPCQNTMNLAITNKDKALQLLGKLYDAEVAQFTLERIWSRLPRERIPAVLPRNHCMIISYADSISADGETPLQTLRRFLNVHVGETFGRVHLLPFFPSSSDDGFAVIDYRMVDHHVGSWQDIEDLAGDYDLMFDLVINHCSRESLWFADFINGRDPGRHYFITLPEESDVSQVVRPRSSPLISWENS